MSNRVILDNFQVGAFYALAESGHPDTPAFVNGVPAADIMDMGVYEYDGNEWHVLPDSANDPENYDALHARDEEFKTWLNDCGLGWRLEDGEIVPNNYGSPSNPGPVPGFSKGEASAPVPANSNAPVSQGMKNAYAIGIGMHVKYNERLHTVVSRELTTTGITLYMKDEIGRDVTATEAEYEVLA